MFVTLGDLGQVATEPTVWRTAANALVTLAGNQDWGGLSAAAASLSRSASDAGANTVSTAADAVKAAADAKAQDALTKALADLANAARLEDIATDSDRIMNEELVGKQIDSLQGDITAFATAHGGLRAVWDAATGGPDLSPLRQEADSIAAQIAKAPLTIEGRQRLLGRLAQVSAKIQPGDWKLIVAGTLGTLALTWASTKAISLAQASAAAAAEAARQKAVARLRKTSIGRKLGLKEEVEKAAKKKGSSKKRPKQV
jgi:hypothetical protein